MLKEEDSLSIMEFGLNTYPGIRRFLILTKHVLYEYTERLNTYPGIRRFLMNSIAVCKR